MSNQVMSNTMVIRKQVRRTFESAGSNTPAVYDAMQEHISKIQSILIQWPYISRHVPHKIYQSDLGVIYKELCSIINKMGALPLLFQDQCIKDLGPLLHEYTWTADQVHDTALTLSRNLRDIMFALGSDTTQNEDIFAEDTLGDFSTTLGSELVELFDRTRLQEEILPLETTIGMIQLRTTNRLLQQTVSLLQDIAKAGMLLVISLFKNCHGGLFSDSICGSDLGRIRAKYPCISTAEYWSLSQTMQEDFHRRLQSSKDSTSAHSKTYNKIKATAIVLRETRKRFKAEALKCSLITPSDSISSRDMAGTPTLPPRRVPPPTKLATPLPPSTSRPKTRVFRPTPRLHIPRTKSASETTSKQGPNFQSVKLKPGTLSQRQQQRPSTPISPRTNRPRPTSPVLNESERPRHRHNQQHLVPGLIELKPNLPSRPLTRRDANTEPTRKPKVKRRGAVASNWESRIPDFKPLPVDSALPRRGRGRVAGLEDDDLDGSGGGH